MNWYLITVSTYLPYIRSYDYRIKGSSESVAISKAVKNFRKEAPIKRKRVKELSIKLIRLGKSFEYSSQKGE